LKVFKNFKVCYNKVTYILNWLREKNCYYVDIIINHKVLWFLLFDNSIDNQFQNINDDYDFKNKNNIIIHIFVSLLLSTNHKDIVIRNILNKIQNENHLII